MNFLAHLHLAKLADSSLIGNIAADFIRGDPYLIYCETIADGIMLHRRIDKMIDSLPIIKACRHYFSSEHTRVAPITLDIVWDHFLALHWHTLVPTISLRNFIMESQKKIELDHYVMPDQVQTFITTLWQQNWLERYADLQFIAHVLQGMAQRRPKLIKLATSINDVERHYIQLETTFFAFYPEIMTLATQKLL